MPRRFEPFPAKMAVNAAERATHLRRIAHILRRVFLCAALASTGAGAVDGTASMHPGIDIAARYPSGTIDSTERASAALDDAARTRLQVEAQLRRDESVCAPKFMTNRCLDQARERHREALTRLKSIEIEANTTKRRARIDQRDHVLAEKEKSAAADASAREAKAAKAPEAASSAAIARPAESPMLQSPDRGVSGPAAIARRPRHATPRQAGSAAASIDAVTERANIAAFDRKATESAQRQREIAANKAEKERDRARKRAAASAGAAPLAPALPGVAK